MKVLLAIPCYNCEVQVERVLQALESLPAFSQIEAAMFIDNRSTDGTLQRLLKLRRRSPIANKFLIAQNEKNYGLGGSHKVAFNHAIQNGFDAVLLLHGDDQADTADIPAMLQLAQTRERTILGSRFMPASRLHNYSLSRIWGNRVLNLVFTIATRTPTRDLGSGLNLFRAVDLKKIPYRELSDSFNFNVDLLLEFYRRSLAVDFMPIHWRESDQTSNARNFNVAFKMLRSLLLWLSRIPRRSPETKNYATVLFPIE